MTEKKLKKQLRSIWFHYDRLETAVRRAIQSGLIVFPSWDESPMRDLHDFETRIESTTKEQIARAIHHEIKAKI